MIVIVVLVTNGPPLGGQGTGSIGPLQNPDAVQAKVRSTNNKTRTGRRLCVIFTNPETRSLLEE